MPDNIEIILNGVGGVEIVFGMRSGEQNVSSMNPRVFAWFHSVIDTLLCLKVAGTEKVLGKYLMNE